MLWILILLLPITYFVQEMVARLGIATGKGHAAMIYKRFGKWWGRFSLIDLLVVNFLTLITEFAAISLALSALGVSPYLAVPVSAIGLILLVVTGSYLRWERTVIILCLLDLTWFALAAATHPRLSAVAYNSFVPQLPLGRISSDLVFLIIAIVGTIIPPFNSRRSFSLPSPSLSPLLSCCFTTCSTSPASFTGCNKACIRRYHGDTRDPSASPGAATAEVDMCKTIRGLGPANLLRVFDTARSILPVLTSFLLASSLASAQNCSLAPRPSEQFSFMQLLAAKDPHDIANERWNPYRQFTYISNRKPSFYAPYTNLNGSTHSLFAAADRSFTGTATLDLDVRLWRGAEGYLVPELITERPFSQLQGWEGAIHNFDFRKAEPPRPRFTFHGSRKHSARHAGRHGTWPHGSPFENWSARRQ